MELGVSITTMYVKHTNYKVYVRTMAIYKVTSNNCNIIMYVYILIWQIWTLPIMYLSSAPILLTHDHLPKAYLHILIAYK